MIPVEPVSLTLGAVALASLFSLCVQCFDLIEIGRNLGLDGELLAIKLSIEKRRLMIWGEAVGILRPDTNRDPGLDEPATRQLVEQILGSVQRLFHQADDLKSKYGLETASSRVETGTTTVIGSTVCSAAFENSALVQFQTKLLGHHNKIGLRAKTKWAIRDSKKFGDLIQNLKDLLDGLSHITPSTSTMVLKGQLIRQETNSIPDLQTLKIIESTCSDEDWRSSASAASDYLINLNRITPAKRKEISDWMVDEPSPVQHQLTEDVTNSSTRQRLDRPESSRSAAFVPTHIVSAPERAQNHNSLQLEKRNAPYCGDRTKVFVLCSTSTLVAYLPGQSQGMAFHPAKSRYIPQITTANATTASRIMQSVDLSDAETHIAIYCPPRMRYVHMALAIADPENKFIHRYTIRFDDRLLDRETELNNRDSLRDRMMGYHRDIEHADDHTVVSNIVRAIDMNWLEQRIDVIDTPSYVSDRTQLDWYTIFRQSQDDGAYCTAIIVLAGLPACRDMLSMAPVIPPDNFKEGRVYQLRTLAGVKPDSTHRYKAEHLCNVTKDRDFDFISRHT